MAHGGPSLRKDVTPFRRVLVANRGEIAVRIIRACHEAGLEAVAVYSDADATARHVRMADRAVRLGPAPPAESYLRIEAIVAAAIETGAGAIHPGYGFLAERAAFARAVEDAGLVFVGPSSAAIDALGDKLHARRIAREVGVAVVPGTLEPAPVERAEDVDRILADAAEVGYPLLVKAAAGGGGRGMRRVTRPADLPAALAAGSHEAAAAFGDGSVYLEREIAPARHIEVQMLGDSEGHVVAIGERDCSIQPRHQKLVEEAPAPGLAEDERRALHAMAVRVAAAAGLRNAATAEFLRAPDGQCYFLEVNTRLQVEHGITELVSGLDIVREQLALAAGEPLSEAALAAADRAATPSAHAIEVRLTAEDPSLDFAPTPGRVRRWTMPAGPGVRVDAAIEAGERIPPDYDNLIAKIMVVGHDRATAIARLRRALDETEIAGIQTTLPFHRFVARSAAFATGDLSIGWIGEHWDGPAARARAVKVGQLAAGIDALGDGVTTAARAPTPRTDGATGDQAATDRNGHRPGASIASDARDDSAWAEAGRQAATDRWPR